MKVYVYFNIRRKLFSVKALEGHHKGTVFLHVEEVFLHGVQFKVSESGRQRVLKEKRKNVHAGVVGHVDCARVITDRDEQITYNPYRFSSFVKLPDETPVTAANHVRLSIEDNKAKIRAIHAW